MPAAQKDSAAPLDESEELVVDFSDIGLTDVAGVDEEPATAC